LNADEFSTCSNIEQEESESCEMKYVTIRNLPPQVADALQREKQHRHQSLNQTAIELLAQALGVTRQPKQGNGLAALAGGWTDPQWESFEASVAVTRQVDEELWR